MVDNLVLDDKNKQLTPRQDPGHGFLSALSQVQDGSANRRVVLNSSRYRLLYSETGRSVSSFGGRSTNFPAMRLVMPLLASTLTVIVSTMNPWLKTDCLSSILSRERSCSTWRRAQAHIRSSGPGFSGNYCSANDRFGMVCLEKHGIGIRVSHCAIDGRRNSI